MRLLPILHRVHNPAELSTLSSSVGIEFDVHAYGDRLVVTHDAFSDGIDLEDFLRLCKTIPILAINVKEEGIEERVIRITQACYGDSFFLFDVPFPQIFRMGNKYGLHLCLRVSDIETLDLNVCRGFATFIWLDTFCGNLWLNQDEYMKIKELGYRICFVSPELHRPPKGDAHSFSKQIEDLVSLPEYSNDYICTKHLTAWI